MKYFFVVLFLLSFTLSSSQQSSSLYKLKTLRVSDTIQVDSVSINPSSFYLTNLKNERIPASLYAVDFQKASLKFINPIAHDSVRVHYLSYPSFITNTYQEIEESVIVNRTGNLKRLYRLSEPSETLILKTQIPIMRSFLSVFRGCRCQLVLQMKTLSIRLMQQVP